jgi:hypothetical protein
VDSRRISSCYPPIVPFEMGRDDPSHELIKLARARDHLRHELLDKTSVHLEEREGDGSS